LKEAKKGSAFFFQSSNFLALGSSGISTVQRLFIISCSFFQSGGDCMAWGRKKSLAKEPHRQGTQCKLSVGALRLETRTKLQSTNKGVEETSMKSSTHVSTWAWLRGGIGATVWSV